MKWPRLLPDFIKYFVLCLIIFYLSIYVHKRILRPLNSLLGDNIPNMDYETVFRKDTSQIKKPDTEVKWLEKIKQVEVKPETVKVVQYVYDTPEELVTYIKADGRKIRIRTQQCGDIFGNELTYPYYKYYQFVPPNSMIYYKDYWDWDRLFVSVTTTFSQDLEIKLGSSLQFNPWAIKIQPYVSNRGTGIEIRKKLW